MRRMLNAMYASLSFGSVRMMAIGRVRSSIVRRGLFADVSAVVRPRSSARYHHRREERLSLSGAPHARPVLSAARRERSARGRSAPQRAATR